MLTYLRGIWWLYAYIPPSIIIIQHFIDMRTGNVDQMISKHAFQAWFSSSSRFLDPSSSDFHQVHKSPIQVQLFGIFHTDEEFSFMPADACEIGTKTWSIFHVLIKIVWFSPSPRFLDPSSSDFHQVHKPPIQVQLFEISHTNGGFFFHVSVCMRNRHSVVVVSLIGGSGGRESYRGWTGFSGFRGWTEFSAHYGVI